VDVYYWRRRPTVIHDHHFMGAFQCLYGKNLDFSFKFKSTKKLGKFHALGSLELMREKVLSPGEVVRIDYLDKFIHQNHHHTDLTVNLCFRIPEQKGKGLSNYLYSGLKYEKNAPLINKTERLIRSLHFGSLKLGPEDLNIDEKISFMLETYRVSLQNKPLQSFRQGIHKSLMKELGLNIDEMMKSHDEKIDMLEENYF
jgi:hypothetical protein